MLIEHQPVPSFQTPPHRLYFLDHDVSRIRLLRRDAGVGIKKNRFGKLGIPVNRFTHFVDIGFPFGVFELSVNYLNVQIFIPAEFFDMF